MWHGAFLYVTWLMTQLSNASRPIVANVDGTFCRWQDSSYMWHGTNKGGVTHSSCDMTNSYMWHNPSTYLTQLIYTCDMTHLGQDSGESHPICCRRVDAAVRWKLRAFLMTYVTWLISDTTLMKHDSNESWLKWVANHQLSAGRRGGEMRMKSLSPHIYDVHISDTT